jgi:hypothetical protein
VCDGGLKTAFRRETLAGRRLDRLDWGPGDQGCNGKWMRRSRGSAVGKKEDEEGEGEGDGADTASTHAHAHMDPDGGEGEGGKGEGEDECQYERECVLPRVWYLAKRQEQSEADPQRARHWSA